MLTDAGEFQCSSASRKFLKLGQGNEHQRLHCGFSALQRAENSSKIDFGRNSSSPLRVSVLFSEPKIPQMTGSGYDSRGDLCFSALQRAENSSKMTPTFIGVSSDLFQCSSASRKFLKDRRGWGQTSDPTFQCSSASRKFLKRLEPSPRRTVSVFQCSSASRKFLKVSLLTNSTTPVCGFSALQRAENSSKTTNFYL